MKIEGDHISKIDLGGRGEPFIACRSELVPDTLYYSLLRMRSRAFFDPFALGIGVVHSSIMGDYGL